MDTDKGEDIKVIINGIEKDSVPRSSIVDFGWFVKSVASREGIKNFFMKINGELVPHQDIQNVKVSKVNTLELSTYDAPRKHKENSMY